MFALGKIPEEESANAILDALHDGQYGQEILQSAQKAFLEIGKPAIQPLINAVGHYPQDRLFYSSVLVKFGATAVDPLIWTLENSHNMGLNEAVVNILGEIGDIRAVNPIINSLKNYGLNRDPGKRLPG